MSQSSDAAFLARLRDSKQYATLAAHILSKWYPVTIRPTYERPDVLQRAEYADQGDLEIIQIVEVKHRPELHFTCRADFPYPTIIVDQASSYDKKKQKPYMYMILNADCTHYAIVRGDTKKHWTEGETVNKFNGMKVLYYYCPVQLVNFFEVPG